MLLIPPPLIVCCEVQCTYAVNIKGGVCLQTSLIQVSQEMN